MTLISGGIFFAIVVAVLILNDGDDVDISTLFGTIKVSSPVQPPIAIIDGPTSIEVNKQVSFSAGKSSSPNGEIVRYEWDFGDGKSGEGSSVNHVYEIDGDNTITLTITDDKNQTDTITYKIVVKQQITPPISRLIPIPIIQAPSYDVTTNPAFFDASKSYDPDGEIVRYEWDFGDGSIGSAKTVNHKFENPGTYTVILTVMDNDTQSNIIKHTVKIEKGLDTCKLNRECPKTDKEIYELNIARKTPVNITGEVLNRKSGIFLTLQVEGPDKKIVDEKSFIPPPSGSYDHTYFLTKDSSEGTYIIRSIYNDEVIGISVFYVGERSSQLIRIPFGTSSPSCTELHDGCYDPERITIHTEDKVTWSNTDTTEHTVTSGSPKSGSDGKFDSGLIKSEETFSFVFDGFESGTYKYYCIVHPWMTGMIIVQEY